MVLVELDGSCRTRRFLQDSTGFVVSSTFYPLRRLIRHYLTAHAIILSYVVTSLLARRHSQPLVHSTICKLNHLHRPSKQSLRFIQQPHTLNQQSFRFILFFEIHPVITLSTNNGITLCSYYVQLPATLREQFRTTVDNVTRLFLRCPKLRHRNARRR